jgi:predicted RNA-binding protein YlqC (UPF0109 family)
MEALVRHLVEPIVKHPESISVQTVEGEDVVTLELSVHPDDRAILLGDDGNVLRAIRTVVSAAAGSQKASLDLMGEDGDDGEE